MNILISGGAGLIGSNLCRRLLTLGHVVMCDDIGDLDNVKDLIKNPNFIRMQEGEVYPTPDQIYNLASPTAPNHYKACPIETIITNVHVTQNLLEMAERNKIPFFFFFSIRVLENNDTFDNNSCYIESKRVAETLCYEYMKKGVNVKVVRMFNVFGPGMKKDDGRVIPTFIRRAMKNEILYVYGNGEQMDSFTYVDDAITTLINIMDAPERTRKPFSIGNKDFISIFDLAKLIVKEINSKSPIHLVYKSENKFRTFSEEDVNVSIKTDLVSGLQKTINYMEGENG